MWNLVFYSWIPSLCMLVFGLLTIQQVRQSKMRIGTQTNPQQQQNKDKVDRQLIQVLIIQAFVFISTTTAFPICQLYISITTDTVKINELDKAKYSKTSLCGHLSKVDTSLQWTSFGPPELLFMKMNLLNMDTSLL